MNAVDSEFRKNMVIDSCHANVVSTNLANKESPYFGFKHGNLQSLQKQGVRDVLVEFHQRWYSSNIMTLCISGNFSIQDLETMADKYFGAIENKEVQVTCFKNSYLPENLGKFVGWVPSKDLEILSV